MTRNDIEYRMAVAADIPGMVRLRVEEGGADAYWQQRIGGYLSGELSPQQALAPRTAFVAIKDGQVAGFIAGHLTHRFGCDGELQWLNTAATLRGKGIATVLLGQLAGWFAARNALYVCVDCDPDNAAAQFFYKRHGAERLNEHWLVWKDVGVLAKTLWG